jgi:hypothetical protein
LEKAVVLELTLKHVKALTNLIDQQQQKIIALQSGLQAGECPRAISIFKEFCIKRVPALILGCNIPAANCLCTFTGGEAFLSFLKGQTFHLECCCVPPGMNTY